jgi:glycosyltransferase involved in cell wall biosynthesis
MRRILIINNYFKIGGVETFLLRLIPVLKDRGIEVSMLLLHKEYDADLFAKLQEMADVHFLSDIMPLRRENFVAAMGQRFDWIFTTFSHALILGGYLIGRGIYPAAHLCCGVYQTEIFCHPPRWKRPDYLFVRYFFSNLLPHHNILFCNEAGRKQHAMSHHVSFSDSTVANLIIDAEGYYPPERSMIQPWKIVSVGRICDFKTYNFTMLDTLEALNKRGMHFEYHVHGDGDMKDELEYAVQQRGLTGQVILHGEFPYHRFKEIVSDAFVFVGSGTSLIEAAACGVPSLTTIEYSKQPETYGFIHEVPGTSLIEPDLPYPRYALADKIEWLKRASSGEYEAVVQRGMEKVTCYSGSTVAEQYLDYFNTTREMSKRLPMYRIATYVTLFNKVLV